MKLRKAHIVLFLVAVVAVSSLFVRVHRAYYQPMWVDEAESAINALTILDHGLPLDRYLGLPIFENTLIRPWPEHPEYEFQDVSYSNKGLVIYHGWLPLYAMAGCLALFEMKPKPGPTGDFREMDIHDFRLRSFAARVPSLLLSVLLLVLIFFTGRELFGTGTAYTALIAACLSNNLVDLGYQARYYCATIVTITAFLLVFHLVIKHGRWRDFMLCSCVLTIMFYTHMLSFAIACSVFVLLLPYWILHKAGFLKACIAGILVLAFITPWIWYSGYLEHLGEIPPARHIINFPEDLGWYFFKRIDYTVFFLILLSLLLVSKIRPSLLPHVINQTIREYSKAIVLLLVWLPASILLYVLFMPAASFFLNRLSLVLVVPGLLLASLFFFVAANLLRQKRALLLAPTLYVLFLLVTNRSWVTMHNLTPELVDAFAPVTVLKELPLPVGTKFYATPNNHFIMSYYTGLPFQSIAPVRRAFLESHKGPIVIVDQIHRDYADIDPLGMKGLAEAATADGLRLSKDETEQWVSRLHRRIVLEDEYHRVKQVLPSLGPLPAFARKAIEKQRKLDKTMFQERNTKLAIIFNGYNLTRWEDWWVIFFYRYVNPEKRMGENLNYRKKLPLSTLRVGQAEKWKVYFVDGESSVHNQREL